ncbi:MAG: hypothetical protein ACLRSW_04210 [Christensenellaceae bacterium]
MSFKPRGSSHEKPRQEGEPSFLSLINSYEITYGNFAGSSAADDKDIYIDNIRLEHRSN